ncbi:MFS transporter [Caulobacter sp. KR2-114]|uniref:MFS transporter n=1 Tax=Caulobacter sp. KR2-114 TaxID=3400912 RepID=UPI003C061291
MRAALDPGPRGALVAEPRPAKPSAPGRDGPYAWYVVVVMCLGFTFSYMDRSILPLLIGPLERSLHLTDTTVALLQGAAFAIFYALFGLPLARVADRSHRRNLILVGVVAWSLATVACGLAQSVVQLLAARVCVAIGEAVLAPAAVSVIADYFTPRWRTRALSLYSMGVFFGGGLSLSLGGALLRALGPQAQIATPFGLLESWRIVFITLGAAGAILVPLLLAVREPPRVADGGESAGEPASLAELGRTFARKRGALFTTIIGFATIALGAQTVQVWAPTLFVRVHGWSIAGAGQRMGAFTIVLGPLGALTGAFLAERLERAGRSDGKIVVGLVSASLCVAASLLATAGAEQVAFAGVVAMQYVVAFNFGLVQAALAELLPNRMRAVGSACYVAASNLLAATLGPLLVGLLNDHLFRDPAMIATSIRCVAPVAFLAAALIMLWGRRSYRDQISLNP